MADKVKAAAAAEAIHIRDMTAEAARSGAYVYPFHVRENNRLIITLSLFFFFHPPVYSIQLLKSWALFLSNYILV
jgi:hypothetical protein